MRACALEQEYERVTALRDGAMELIDEHLTLGSEDQDYTVIVGLQEVANRLGAVERSLLARVNGTL